MEVSYYGQIFTILTKCAADIRDVKPALDTFGKIAIIASPLAGILGGTLGLYNGETAAIITTVSALPTAIYGIQQMLQTPPVSRINDEQTKYEIDLISMYLTLKQNPQFLEDTQMVCKIFKSGIEMNMQDRLKNATGYNQLRLSQMVLKKEGV